MNETALIDDMNETALIDDINETAPIDVSMKILQYDSKLYT